MKIGDVVKIKVLDYDDMPDDYIECDIEQHMGKLFTIRRIERDMSFPEDSEYFLDGIPDFAFYKPELETTSNIKIFKNKDFII